MTNIRPILKIPNPILKQVAKQIQFPLSQQTISNISALKTSFRDSFATLGKRTVGLAAPQIGISQRFFITSKRMNYQGLSQQMLKSLIRNFNVYINPKILAKSQKLIFWKENCLSVGDSVYQVQRAQDIEVQYFDVQGNRITQKMTGLKARVFLHEYDHLDGILMTQLGSEIKPQVKIDQQDYTKNMYIARKSPSQRVLKATTSSSQTKQN